MRRKPCPSRVATVIGLVLVVSTMVAAVLVPPIGLAQVTVLAFLLPILSMPFVSVPILPCVHRLSRLPHGPRAPPHS
jgi:hypothetical protein